MMASSASTKWKLSELPGSQLQREVQFSSAEVEHGSAQLQPLRTVGQVGGQRVGRSGDDAGDTLRRAVPVAHDADIAAGLGGRQRIGAEGNVALRTEAGDVVRQQRGIVHARGVGGTADAETEQLVAVVWHDARRRIPEAAEGAVGGCHRGSLCSRDQAQTAQRLRHEACRNVAAPGGEGMEWIAGHGHRAAVWHG